MCELHIATQEEMNYFKILHSYFNISIAMFYFDIFIFFPERFPILKIIWKAAKLS